MKSPKSIFPALDSLARPVRLGTRICIIGTSASGKSTLAQYLADSLDIPVFHLDTLAHYPNTQWERILATDFIAAHDCLLQEYDAWIIEGNYSITMPQRLAQASQIIWIDMNAMAAWKRNLQRSQSSDPRVGGVEGAADQLTWARCYQIFWKARSLRKKYLALLRPYAAKVIYLSNWAEVQSFYQRLS